MRLVSSFGLFLALGFLLGSFVIWRKAKDEAFEEEKIFDAIIIVTIAGLIGARLEFIFTHWSEFGFSLIKWLWLTRYAGLGFFGALAGGSIGLWWFVKSGRIDPAGGRAGFWPLADLAVFGLILGQLVVKINGFLLARSWLRLSEVIWLVLILLLLKKLERRYRLFKWYQGKRKQAAPGFLFLTYLLFYFLGQLGLEILRGGCLYLDSLVIFSSLIVFYSRSGRDWQEDLGAIKRK